MAQHPRRGSTTLLWGLLFGTILALLIVFDRLALAGALRRAGLGGGGVLVSLLLSRGVLYVIGLACFFVAGLLAVRRTGAVESGLLAGLMAGAIAGLTNLVFTMVTLSIASHRMQRAAAVRHLTAALRATVGSGIFSAVVVCIAVSLVGAGMGALGALAGRGSAQGLPFQGGPGPYIPGYPPPPPASTPTVGYASSASLTPPGYVPGNDAPTIQTGQP